MKIFDAHCHLRSGKMLERVLPYHEGWASVILVMPNVPRITSASDRDLLWSEMESYGAGLMGTKYLFTQMMVPGLVVDPSFVGVKVYPDAVTTGSHGSGIYDLRNHVDIIDTVAEHDMILLVHAELGSVRSGLRERAWLKDQGDWLVRRYHRMRIIIEHISDRFTVRWMRRQRDNVRATLTLHHMLYNRDDALCNSLLDCCPCIKGEKDRIALAEAMKEDWCMFGSDSAPHWNADKAKIKPNNGVWTPGRAVVERLSNQQFLYARAAEFYRIKDSNDITIRNQEYPNDPMCIYKQMLI